MKTSLVSLFSPKAISTFFFSPTNSGETSSLILTENVGNKGSAQLLALLKTWFWAKKLENHCLRSGEKARCLGWFIMMIQDSLSIPQIFIERLPHQLDAVEPGVWQLPNKTRSIKMSQLVKQQNGKSEDEA